MSFAIPEPVQTPKSEYGLKFTLVHTDTPTTEQLDKLWGTSFDKICIPTKENSIGHLVIDEDNKSPHMYCLQKDFMYSNVSLRKITALTYIADVNINEENKDIMYHLLHDFHQPFETINNITIKRFKECFPVNDTETRKRIEEYCNKSDSADNTFIAIEFPKIESDIEWKD